MFFIVICPWKYWMLSTPPSPFMALFVNHVNRKLLAHLLGDELVHWLKFLIAIYTHFHDVRVKGNEGNKLELSPTFLYIYLFYCEHILYN